MFSGSPLAVSWSDQRIGALQRGQAVVTCRGSSITPHRFSRGTKFARDQSATHPDFLNASPKYNQAWIVDFDERVSIYSHHSNPRRSPDCT
jgi:hypothetical protein